MSDPVSHRVKLDYNAVLEATLERSRRNRGLKPIVSPRKSRIVKREKKMPYKVPEVPWYEKPPSYAGQNMNESQRKCASQRNWTGSVRYCTSKVGRDYGPADPQARRLLTEIPRDNPKARTGSAVSHKTEINWRLQLRGGEDGSAYAAYGPTTFGRGEVVSASQREVFSNYLRHSNSGPTLRRLPAVSLAPSPSVAYFEPYSPSELSPTTTHRVFRGGVEQSDSGGVAFRSPPISPTQPRRRQLQRSAGATVSSGIFPVSTLI